MKSKKLLLSSIFTVFLLVSYNAFSASLDVTVNGASATATCYPDIGGTCYIYSAQGSPTPVNNYPYDGSSITYTWDTSGTYRIVAQYTQKYGAPYQKWKDVTIKTNKFDHSNLYGEGTQSDVWVKAGNRYYQSKYRLWGESYYADVDLTTAAYCDALGYNRVLSYETNTCGSDESDYYRYSATNGWEYKESGSKNRCYKLISKVSCGN